MYDDGRVLPFVRALSRHRGRVPSAECRVPSPESRVSSLISTLDSGAQATRIARGRPRAATVIFLASGIGIARRRDVEG